MTATVNITTPKLARYGHKFARIDAFLEGADALKNSAYINAPDAWEEKEKQAFYKSAYVFNAVKRTVDGLSGMVTFKPPKLDLTPDFDDLIQDVDGIGTDLNGCINRISDALCSVGNIGVLVDYPESEGQLTIAQAQAQGVRPAISFYDIKSILEVKHAKIGNQFVLTRVRLAETYEQPTDDEFYCEVKSQIRVLDLFEGRYRVRIFRENVVYSEIFPRANGQLLREIPFRLITATGDVDKPCLPPLDDLAEVGIAHLNNSAWLEHGLPTIAPVYFIAGMEKPNDGFNFGYNSVAFAPTGDANITLVQASAESFGALFSAMASKVKDMAVIGARFLQTENNTNIAENTASIHRSGDNATLSSISASIEQGITAALKFCTLFMGVKSDTITVTLSRDYLPVKMTSQELTAIVSAWQSGAMTVYDLYDNLVNGNFIQPRDGGVEQFKDELDEEQIQPDIFPAETQNNSQRVNGGL